MRNVECILLFIKRELVFGYVEYRLYIDKIEGYFVVYLRKVGGLRIYLLKLFCNYNVRSN